MELFVREKYLERIRGFYDEGDLIKVITGVRRCGKSSLMQTIAAELRAHGVSENNIIYIDLDKRGHRQVREAEQLERLIFANPCAPSGSARAENNTRRARIVMKWSAVRSSI